MNTASGGAQAAGRDLPGFAQQARDTAQGIKRAIYANDKEIASRYGKAGVKKSVTPPKGLLTGQEERRQTRDGKIAVYDSETKEFLRYE